jgi:hypothetical protein
LQDHLKGKPHKKKQQRLSEGGNYEGEKEAGETSVYCDARSHFEEDITSKNNKDHNDGSSSDISKKPESVFFFCTHKLIANSTVELLLLFG